MQDRERKRESAKERERECTEARQTERERELKNEREREIDFLAHSTKVCCVFLGGRGWGWGC